MDLTSSFSGADFQPLSCIDMHTTGEAARILYGGYPDLKGTLIEQLTQAKVHHDAIRKQIMCEPRGHSEMYGAILRPVTELVSDGKAHIGVIFIHNGGYSTMCGHGTIALGRFLVDTHDLNVFPQRDSLQVDIASGTTKIILHAPCGPVEVTVPVLEGGKKADPSRPVSFISVPSWATVLDLEIKIPDAQAWPELGERRCVTVDMCYGGGFSALVSASALGFPLGLKPGKQAVDMNALSRATKQLKGIIVGTTELAAKLVHPEESELSFLSAIMVVDAGVGVKVEGTSGVETGLLFFGDQQVDRSPTGSLVSARMAAAYAKGILQVGEGWTYNSFVSNGFEGEGSFVGTIREVLDVKGVGKGVVVKTEGKAWYTGASTFIKEKGDKLGQSGFRVPDLMDASK